MCPDGPDPASHGRSEADLLTRLRNGDDAAYSELVRENAGRLLAVIRRYLRDESEAQDALQETFISAFKALDRFEGGSKLSTWLHRIAVNAALMRIRSRQRRPEEPIEEWLPRFSDEGRHQRHVAPWPAQALARLERREVRQTVRKAINRLPETHRNVLLLRDIEEFDTATTADLLGISPNAVKIRLHRARQALRTLIEPHMVGKPS